MLFTQISARPLLVAVSTFVTTFVTTLLPATTLAQNSLYQEQGQLIRAPRALGVLGDNLFGDTVNYYNGALSFSQTDVSLPGNDALPMAVTRTFNAGSAITTKGHFGNWELDIPRMSGTFSKTDGWTSFTATGGRTNQRCSQFGSPRTALGIEGTQFVGAAFAAREFWHGNFISVPGGGSQEVLRRNPSNANIPQDGNSYPLVTKSLWSIRCLPTLANAGGLSPDHVDAGEGFLAVSPDGTKYQFDWLARRTTNDLTKSTLETVGLTTPQDESSLTITPVDTGEDPNLVNKIGLLLRVEVWLMPTKITDKHGNTITYTYDTTDPWKVTKMVASDGRSLTFTYLNTGVAETHQIDTVFDGTRTWRYNYQPGVSSTFNGILSLVTNPDGSQWKVGGIEPLARNIRHTTAPTCENPGVLNPFVLSGNMTHPSGAVGTFTLTPTLHGRSQVDEDCISTPEGDSQLALNPRYFDQHSLTQKTITGPGLPSMTWLAQYSPATASWASCPTCPAAKTTTVTDPKNDVTRYTFGTRFRVNEGLLLQTDTGFNGSTALRTVTQRYRAVDPNAGPYVNPVGYSDQNRGDGDLSALLLPIEERITTQQGVSFNWNAANFDTKARATTVTRASSLGFLRTEKTVFTDIPSKWVLGLTASVTETGSGLVMQSNTYDTTNGNMLSMTRFGHLQETRSYHPDGTLKTKADGAGRITNFANYKRGLAQNVSYPDGTNESALVNNIGLITSTTDALGFSTNYGYDAAGRLSRIIYPSGDSTGWNDTTITTEQVNTDEYGIAPGHWKQTVATGNGVSVTYLDGFWRPVLGRNYDAANEAATRKMVLRKFDHKGQTTFESYPQRNITSVTAAPAGTATLYDALSRPTQIDADSELGKLSTRFAYLNGFQKRITNPRGNATTSSYQVFDEPTESALTNIIEPESVTLGILRDVFGKPKSVTRSGPGVSATRSYVYDAKQRLCKTIEPETGATVQTYDAANNTLWRAAGLNLPSAACDDTSVPAANKVSYSYDTRNRLTATAYGDGSPAITRSYTADGLPQTVTSNGLTWTTSYNRRRLPVMESLPVNGTTYNLSSAYDANGHLSQITYPNGLVINHTPNAVGEATQVGKYATGISYHPNGAIAGFTYGNGIVHTLTLNTRNLPTESKDTGILRDLYNYDANANVVGIGDQQENLSSRSMSYDGLDRLTSANAPNLWGMASYTYDALDNLRSSAVGTRSSNHTYDLGGTNRLLSISTNGSVSNYLYDAQGNITQRGAQGFKFDLANRMSSATGKASYSYDGMGHRTKMLASDGSTRLQIYSQAGQLWYATQSATGGKPASTTNYIYLHRGLIAEVNQ